MPYPHRLSITRPGEGGDQDRETGVWVPAEPITLYDGTADVQDGGVVLERAADGTPTLSCDAQAFLEDWSGIGQIRPDQDALVEWEDGSTSSGKVVRARRLDGVVFLRWLTGGPS